MKLKRWEGLDHRRLSGLGEEFVFYSKYCGNIFIFTLIIIAYYT